jgi:hypothetical protein
MRRLTIALGLAALVAGCGGGGERKRPARHPAPSVAEASTALPATIAALLDRVPGTSDEIGVMDLATARRQLGLDAGFDPAGYGESLRVASHDRFDTAALTLLGYLTEGDELAWPAAIDHGRVTAAVSGASFLGEHTLILATTQPRAEIEQGLAQAGAPATSLHSFTIAPPRLEGFRSLIAGNGFVILASSRRAALATLRRRTADPRLARARAMLERVGGALRVFQRVDDDIDAGAACVQAMAGGQRFDAHDTEDLLLDLDEQPQAARVVLGRAARGELASLFRARAVRIDGRTLHIDVRSDESSGEGAASIADHIRPAQVYRCR